MQTNYFSKDKDFINNLFSKKKKEEINVIKTVNDADEELVAGGFTKALEHYIKKYKRKESD